jgi:hypothetical protein
MALQMQSKRNIIYVLYQMQSILNFIYITYWYGSADAIQTKPLTTKYIKMVLQMQSKLNLDTFILCTQTALQFQSRSNL